MSSSSASSETESTSIPVISGSSSSASSGSASSSYGMSKVADSSSVGNAQTSQSSYTEGTSGDSSNTHGGAKASNEYRKTYFPALIARRPCLVLCSTIWIVIVLSFIGFFAATTKIDAGGTFYPPNETVAWRFDAFLQRRKDDETLPATAERTEVGYTFFLYYESKGDDNVFTDSRIRKMKEVEDRFINHPDFSEFCLLEADGAGGMKCRTWLSVVPKFFPNPNNTDVIQPIQPTLDAIAADSFERDFFLEKDYLTTGSSSVTKSMLQFGLPYKDYRNANTEESAQQEKFTKFIDDFLDPLSKASNGELGVYYVGDVITDLEINRRIIQDLVIIGLSVFAVFVLIWIQTWSVFLAMCAMVHILMSAPIAFFFYRMLFQFSVFPAFNFVAIFVVLGIGADDVFVFTDAWKQSRHDPVLVADNEVRLSWVWRRAGKSMLITSFTTFAAFVATSTSTVPAIRTFGIYAAITVFMNFGLCISWYAGCVMFWHKFLEYKCWGCPRFADKPPPTSLEMGKVIYPDDGSASAVSPLPPPQTLDEKVDGYRPIERFYFRRFAPFIARAKWPLLAAFVAVIIAGIVGSSQLTPPSTRGIGLPKGHPLLEVLRISDTKFKKTREDVEQPIFLVYGIKGIDRSGRDPNDQTNLGKTIFDDNFSLRTVAEQQALVNTCTAVKADSYVLKDSAGNGLGECFIEIFRAWRVAQGLSADVTPESAVGSELLRFQAATESEDVREYFGFRSDGSVKFAVLKFTSNMQSIPTTAELDDHFDHWTQINNARNALHPATLQGWDTTEVWVWKRASEVYARLAVIGLITAMFLAYLVLILATLNIIVASYAFITLAGVAVSVIGFIVLLGWKLDFNEAIAMTVLAGLSVDYVVHMAVAYIHGDSALEDTRFNRMRHSVTEMGISVCGGAATTMVATGFMFAATFPFFFRFGAFIFITISFSFLYSNFVFTSLCAAAGPTGTTGNLLYYAKKLLGKETQ